MATKAQLRRTQKFLSKQPYHLGTSNGADYYEHPTLGDEAPIVRIKDGVLKHTELWELPLEGEDEG